MFVRLDEGIKNNFELSFFLKMKIEYRVRTKLKKLLYASLHKRKEALVAATPPEGPGIAFNWTEAVLAADIFCRATTADAGIVFKQEL
jgi:hypothetical protein